MAVCTNPSNWQMTLLSYVTIVLLYYVSSKSRDQRVLVSSVSPEEFAKADAGVRGKHL
jgi:hypothetical protein